MRKIAPLITISKTDCQIIKSLIKKLPHDLSEKLENLELELDRATIVPDEAMPDNVVTMNSTVAYEDLRNGAIRSVQLTYPEQANIFEGRISVLAPVGSALLGLKVGQKITWELPNGKMGTFRVVAVDQHPFGLKKIANGI
jgi:regulator of nucleoside diphosphate kinase